jgi:filamentous hemagglutinin
MRRARDLAVAKVSGLVALSVSWTGSAVAGHPPLPTPCIVSGACGASAQSFVQYGAAGAVVSGNTLNVTQTTSKAILNWADFNIASGFTVNFIQPGATSAVLNNIWSADPSVIAGRMNANGQVYLYNQNGIVFDKGAQIDVGGLVASTLAFALVANSQDPDALFENGILSENKVGMPPNATFVAPPNGAAGAVTVNSGASLTAADGGRIMLLGSAVTNNGSISTPDGQTILGAASKAVYLVASSSPDMRGLLIQVDGGGVTGTVVNGGEITAARGNITLAGLIVNQEGLLSATTSVSANGSIYLVAGDTSAGSSFYNPNPTDSNGKQTAFGGLLPNKGGTLLLAPGSVTEVLPDATDTGTLTVPEQAGFVPSQVDLAGQVVELQGSAAIRAPGGTVNAYATSNPYQLNSTPNRPVTDDGAFYMAPGSTIDVSGLQAVSVPVTQNLVQVTLETNDLQNDPLLRDGFLHGTTVTVDITNPPSLFDVTPYAANIGSNINQMLTAAGAINLKSTGTLITRAGSTLNVSGGSIAYQGGYGPSTTNLLAANGQVYNISTAPSTIEYVGIANGYAYTDPTWGVTNKGNGQSYYAGYTQGANAGTLDVQAPQVYLRGSMLAATVDGLHQRTLSSLAQGGTLVLGCSNCSDSATGLTNFGVNGGVTFADGLTDNLVGNVVLNGNVISSVSLPSVTSLSPTQLTQSGFSTIEVSSNGAVALPAGVTLAIAANGSFTAASTQSIDIAGNIRAPGGSVSLQTVGTGNLLSHDINVAPGAVIDVSGGWTNDSPAVTLLPGTAPVVINGGSVNVSASGSIFLGADTLINVSGGGWINQSNVLSEGTAGKISLAASFSLDPATAATTPFTGLVDLGAGATLLGASLKAGGGGTLALQSGSLTVSTATAGTPGELLLAPDFFTQGGFAQYNLTGQNDVIIGNLKDADDSTPITIAPIEQSLVFTHNAFLQPTGSSLASFSQLETLPAALRAPASVSFMATASDPSPTEIGDVTLARDASIVTDPGADLVLAANGYNGDVRVFGSIIAPAGNITLQLENPANPLQANGDPGFIANQDIELGPDALLAAAGYAQIDTLDPHGYREGSILAGGTISLIANKGFVKTDFGSVINVSGGSGILDLVGVNGVVTTRVASNAGTINIGAREGIVLQGELLAEAASLDGAPIAGAAGGTLNLALGASYTDAGTNGTGLNNTAGDPVYPTTLRTVTLAGLNAAAASAVPPSNQLLSGTAVIDVGTIQGGGFANVTITSADVIAFTGSVTLGATASLTLDAPLFVGNQSAQVNLSAPYIAVGNYFNNSDYFDTVNPSPNAAAVLNPTAGLATLNVNAQLIDVRGISGWSGFAQETLTSSGDIRFVAGANAIGSPPAVNVPGSPNFEGALDTSANLTLQGAQLYPTTATGFAINDLPAAGTVSSPSAPTQVTIASTLPSGTVPATPLAAGGSLSINATDIVQSGVLRAPMGQIALNGIPILDAQGAVVIPGSVTLANGSLTSVSADGLIIPFGSTANGTQWTYSPAPGSTNILTQPPSKQISLNGSNVSINSGANLDLSGGGDLYAYEFVAGQGGSVDVLNPANLPAANHPAGTTVYTYAILPTLNSPFAPIDAQYGQGSAPTGQTITLSGVPGLAAGTYALLPAYYALLPGAFAVQVVQQNSGIVPGSSVAQPDGGYEVAARFGVAGTSILSSLTSTVLIASDTTVRTESQYTDSYANAFFSSAAQASATAAPRLPADAGQLLLSATNSLALNGAISFGTGSFVSGTTSSGAPITTQGQGGDVAITAQNIVVVDATTNQLPAVAGTLQLNVQQLDNLDVQTLILGATSTNTSAGQQLNVGATQTVELKNTAALTAPEISLAAQDSVTVDPNAQISASGTGGATNQVPSALLLSGGGALLRVSNGAATTLEVEPSSLPQNPTGIVNVGTAATVSASGSLLLYGTNNTTLAPGALVSAPAFSLYSSVVSLGDVPAGTPGLALTAQLLGSLKGLTDLTIGSSSTIDFYGALQLGTPGSPTAGLNSISLDAAGLGGYGAGDKVLQAGSITLMNSSGAAASFAAAPDGTGALQLIAGATASPSSGQLTLGSGAKTISGFSSLDLRAAGDIVGQGTGSLSVVSQAPVPINITSAALIGAAGSNQTLTTGGAVTLNASAANSQLVAPAAGLGAALTIQGSAIAQNGTITLPAGVISLTASNGNVTLGAGSTTSATGAVQGFTVTSAVAAGGSIDLASQAGNVVIAGDATLDVSGASSGTGTGAINGDAGSLNVSAANGTFTFAGSTLKGGAAAGQSQGNFSLDVGSGLAGNGFSELESALSSGGFNGALDLRTRGDTAVTIASSVQVASFQLAVDQGTIDVAASGVINTSGSTGFNTNGGSISLWAGNGLTLEGGAQLLANAGANGPAGANGASLVARGGDITLGTVSGNIVIAGGSVQQPTTISMQGGAGGAADSDGSLTLRAPRTASDTGVQIQVQNPSSLDLLTRNPVIVEGYKSYSASTLGNQDSLCGSGGTCDVNDLNGLLFADAQTFVANSSAIAGNLGFANVEIRAGIEIDSSGDLIVNDSTKVWDLASWNAALGAPVNLTLRAAGNLVFESSLSDGFTSSPGKAVNTWAFAEPGTATDSGSYMLTAGADLLAANPLAAVPQPAAASSLDAPPNTGNVILTAGNLIRTGTGNIAIAAGADVLLGYSAGDALGNLYDNGTLQVAEKDPLSSAIYTAGMPSILTPAQSVEFVPTTLPLKLTRAGDAVAYPTDGGNISIAAADDVRSATSAQLVSDWLWRRGPSETALTPSSGTSWWITFSQFEQGVGVLGGGNLSLTAGRDIVNTDAVIPTTGRLLVAGGTATAADLLLTGGGGLNVRAGGDIISGVFEDDWGNASIAAGGSLTSSSDSTFGQQTALINTSSAGTGLPLPNTEIYPILVVGNGVFDVSARSGIALDGVANSTTLPITAANASLVSALGEDAAFYPYAPTSNPSTLNLVSSAGNVVLNNDPLSNVPIAALSTLNLVYEASPNAENYLAVYPSTLNVASMSGDINLGAPPLPGTSNGVEITLFPAAMGNLNLLAQGSINNNGTTYQIALSEADPSLVPSILAPQTGLGFTGLVGAPLPQVPLHQTDPQPISLVANTGNIDSGTLTFPKAANVIAGGNITDLNFNGKNLNPSDVTLITAGGDINYSTPTLPVTNALEENPNGINLAGPGFLEVLAGGSINLGDSNGIVTSGSLSDVRLPTTGATMILGAGFGTDSGGSLRQPAYQAFTNAYLAPNAASGAPGSYAQTLIDYMTQINPATPGLGYSAALSSFEALTPAQQLPLLAQVLSDELSATGLAHTLQGASYDRGYTAINTLFPAMDANGNALTYDGSLNLFFSQVKTEQGGDINLLVPGGSVVVGLANPPASLSAVKQITTATGLTIPAEVNLGVLVLGEGAIQGFAAQDFLVNQSRMLTLEGGDIILWASNGNIDAGKGAKSASGAPPPVIQTDANGNLFVDPSNSVSGSGIGQLLTTPGVTAGLVNLIAPKGAVNAGDAGIRVAGNLNIAAVQVIGAGNITVVGTSSGVPVSEAGALAGALSGANSLGDASKNAVEQLSQDLGSSTNYQQLNASLLPPFIVVKMFCLGVECETN